MHAAPLYKPEPKRSLLHSHVLHLRLPARPVVEYEPADTPAAAIGFDTADAALQAARAYAAQLVQVLDAGQSVQLHAASEDEINQLCAVLAGLVGGGHA